MDHSEAVAQFCAITEADAATAEQYLTIADQNLESAIALFLEGGGVSLASQQDVIDLTSTRNSSSEPMTGAIEEDDIALSRRLQEEEYSGSAEGVREAIRPVTETLVDPMFGMTPQELEALNLANVIDLGNIHPTRPLGIFNQFAPAPLRRSRNAFEEDDDDDDIEELNSLENSFRTRVRRVDADADGDEFTVEETTGISNMTSTQSRLARLFQPPFDIIRNYDLDTVC